MHVLNELPAPVLGPLTLPALFRLCLDPMSHKSKESPNPTELTLRKRPPWQDPAKQGDLGPFVCKLLTPKRNRWIFKRVLPAGVVVWQRGIQCQRAAQKQTELRDSESGRQGGVRVLPACCAMERPVHVMFVLRSPHRHREGPGHHADPATCPLRGW